MSQIKTGEEVPFYKLEDIPYFKGNMFTEAEKHALYKTYCSGEKGEDEGTLSEVDMVGILDYMNAEPGDRRINPHQHYVRELVPWIYLTEKEKCKQYDAYKELLYKDSAGTGLSSWLQGATHQISPAYGRFKLSIPDVKEHPQRKSDIWDFEPKPLEEILNTYFFTDQGNPIWSRLKSSVDKWIVYAVTEGKWRIDRSKRVFTFKGTNPTPLVLKNSRGFWDNVNEYAPFRNISAITETCNSLYEALLDRLARLETKTDISRNSVKMLESLPLFGMFPSYCKGHEYTHFYWRYEPVKQGGNRPDLEPAKAVQMKRCSVLGMLKLYHQWLGKVR
jgi:hypothetical protein